MRGDPEQPWHWGGHSWVLLLLLLPVLCFQGVHTVLGAAPWAVLPRCAAHMGPYTCQGHGPESVKAEDVLEELSWALVGCCGDVLRGPCGSVTPPAHCRVGL